MFQDFVQIPARSVAENIALFLPDLPWVVDTRAVAGYVLHAPGRDERALIDEAISESLRALETWFTQGFQRAVTYLHTATPRDAGLGPAG